MTKPISFKPSGDANGVLVAIPEADAQVYVSEGFSTDDPMIAAALDAHPAVARAPKTSTAATSKEND